jgi:hypothetical protein
VLRRRKILENCHAKKALSFHKEIKMKQNKCQRIAEFIYWMSTPMSSKNFCSLPNSKRDRWHDGRQSKLKSNVMFHRLTRGRVFFITARANTTRFLDINHIFSSSMPLIFSTQGCHVAVHPVTKSSLREIKWLVYEMGIPRIGKTTTICFPSWQQQKMWAVR